MIDSGREWIVPDALARGELLYRDVVYWFGPLTPYLHAAAFRLFGSSIRTLALAGALGAAAVLACLYAALRALAGKRLAAAWTLLAVPLLVFMPAGGGAIIGMGHRMWHAAALGLLAVTLASRRGGRMQEAAAGAIAGLAGLCRIEWGVLAAAGAAVALGLASASRARLGAWLRLSAGFLLVVSAGLGFFVWRAGLKAVLVDAPILLFNLPVETRSTVAKAHTGSWLRGLVQTGYGAFVWVAAFSAVELLARRREAGLARRRLAAIVALLLLAAACAAIAGIPSDALLCAAPVACAWALVGALRFPRGPLTAALGGFGAAGILAFHRGPFFLQDGPYVAPPILFAVVCAAGCVSLAAARREPEASRRISTAVALGVALLAAAVFVSRGLAYGQDDRVAIAGTGGMLSASSETAREIEAVAAAVRRGTPADEGLVVFPEGEILNFLSGRANPIRHKLYLPGYLGSANEGEVLDELSRSRVGAVVIWPRSLGEYGKAGFGVDYGKRIRAWVSEKFAARPVGTNPRGPVVLFRRRD